MSALPARASGRALGDFQTPAGLVALVLGALEPIADRWPRVLEPTCGQGRFVAGLLGLGSVPREIQAIEIQDDYCRAAAGVAAGADGSTRVVVTRADLFQVSLERDLSWREKGPLLVVGNPPWVTSAALGRMDSAVRPPRRNDSGARGLSSRTGASNFDVAEAVWLKLLRELAGEEVTIALLCKQTVARRVLQFARKSGLALTDASIRTIDAARWFDVAVDACLFTLSIGRDNHATEIGTEIPVFSGLGVATPTTVMGFWGSTLVPDRGLHKRWEFADGASPRTWRQGIKHDAASVMELHRERGSECWVNRLGEAVDVEPEYVYPLLKAADIALEARARPERGLIVTQRKIGEDTTVLERLAPRLWAYLRANEARFERRKSSIYRGQPPFALFGIGPYTFGDDKVAISGLRKQPEFRAVGPVRGKPVVLDDASYLLPCSGAPEAALLTAICNDPISLGLIGAAAFTDDKRPITKALLQRVDLRAVLERSDRAALLERASRVMIEHLMIEPEDSLAATIDELEREFAKTPMASEHLI